MEARLRIYRVGRTLLSGAFEVDVRFGFWSLTVAEFPCTPCRSGVKFKVKGGQQCPPHIHQMANAAAEREFQSVAELAGIGGAVIVAVLLQAADKERCAELSATVASGAADFN